jgi:hypothetical protein
MSPATVRSCVIGVRFMRATRMTNARAEHHAGRKLGDGRAMPNPTARGRRVRHSDHQRPRQAGHPDHKTARRVTFATATAITHLT